jgi:hypothetical protein
MNIGKLLQIVNERLANVETLAYIDRNWGQLEIETHAVKFPCAITDIESVDYDNLLNLQQVATVDFTVTIAVQNFYNTSQKAPNKAKGYYIFDIIDQVNNCLFGYATPEFATFVRRGLQKVETNKDYSVYTLTYRTHSRSTNNPKTTTIKTVSIKPTYINS